MNRKLQGIILHYFTSCCGAILGLLVVLSELKYGEINHFLSMPKPYIILFVASFIGVFVGIFFQARYEIKYFKRQVILDIILFVLSIISLSLSNLKMKEELNHFVIYFGGTLLNYSIVDYLGRLMMNERYNKIFKPKYAPKITYKNNKTIRIYMIVGLVFVFLTIASIPLCLIHYALTIVVSIFCLSMAVLMCFLMILKTNDYKFKYYFKGKWKKDYIWIISHLGVKKHKGIKITIHHLFRQQGLSIIEDSPWGNWLLLNQYHNSFSNTLPLTDDYVYYALLISIKSGLGFHSLFSMLSFFDHKVILKSIKKYSAEDFVSFMEDKLHDFKNVENYINVNKKLFMERLNETSLGNEKLFSYENEINRICHTLAHSKDEKDYFYSYDDTIRWQIVHVVNQKDYFIMQESLLPTHWMFVQTKYPHFVDDVSTKKEIFDKILPECNQSQKDAKLITNLKIKNDNHLVESPYSELIDYLFEVGMIGHIGYFNENKNEMNQLLITLNSILPEDFQKNLMNAYQAFLVNLQDELLKKADSYIQDHEDDIIYILKEYEKNVKK